MYYDEVFSLSFFPYITIQESFNNATSKWMGEIENLSSPGVSKLLVGNKSDLVSKKVVDSEKAKEMADTAGMPFLETSAKVSTNVEEAFVRMAVDMKQRKDSIPGSRNERSMVTITSKEVKEDGGCWC